MDNLSHGRVIGIDVSRDWLDLHCLPDGHRCRVPNASAGHAAVADLARDREAIVCFESTVGQDGSSGQGSRQKVLRLARCPPRRSRHLRKAVARAPRPIGSMRNLSPSVPEIGPVANTMLIAEMPEIGTITGQEAAALTGLAPVAYDSGTRRGKRAIAGRRRALRHVMFRGALVAAHHNPSLRSFADRLRKAGKPHKVIITAIARTHVTMANSVCKTARNGQHRLPERYSF